MDLGSMICTPRSPKCEKCPLEMFCLGKDMAEALTKVKRARYISTELFFGVHVARGKIAMTPSKGTMYRGMLLFPEIDPAKERFLGSYKHSYTKYRLTVNLYKSDTVPEDVVWVDLDTFSTGRFPTLVKKAAKFLHLADPTS